MDLIIFSSNYLAFYIIGSNCPPHYDDSILLSIYGNWLLNYILLLFLKAVDGSLIDMKLFLLILMGDYFYLLNILSRSSLNVDTFYIVFLTCMFLFYYSSFIFLSYSYILWFIISLNFLCLYLLIASYLSGVIIFLTIFVKFIFLDS